MGNRRLSSHRSLGVLASAQVFWVGLVCLLGAWWAKLVMKQAGKIEELEVAAGLASSQAHHYWERTQRMLFWESSTFFVLVLISAAFVFWIYWREVLRARSVEAFFASVTHELRTPLTSIRLQAESIAENFSEDSSERSLVDRLMEDTVRLEAQVERTLELARVEGGGPVFIQPLQLKPWLDRQIQAWRGSYGNRMEISTQVEDVTIAADAASLQMILRNLMENSVRHSKKSKVQVTVATEVAGDAVTLHFSDDGSGYAGSARELGKLFHRGSSSQGTRVGLYLVQTLMKKMGGEARFSPGDSAGFRVILRFSRETAHG